MYTIPPGRRLRYIAIYSSGHVVSLNRERERLEKITANWGKKMLFGVAVAKKKTFSGGGGCLSVFDIIRAEYQKFHIQMLFIRCANSYVSCKKIWD